MRLAHALSTLHTATTTTTSTTTTPNGLTPAERALLFPHRSLVGQVIHDVQSFATAWLPVFFIVALAFTVYLLWKFLGTMPRTKPQNMATKGTSSVTWSDVAGVEEVDRSSWKSSTSCATRSASRRWGRRFRRASCSTARRAPARRCSRRRWRTSPARTSTRPAPRRSWRCSPASAPRHPQAFRGGAEERAGDRFHRRARLGRRPAHRARLQSRAGSDPQPAPRRA